jgi:NAD+ diphosphatase
MTAASTPPCLVFQGGRLVLSGSGRLLLAPSPPEGAEDPHAGPLHLGHGALDPEAGGGAVQESETRVVVLPPDAALPEGTIAVPLRQAMVTLDDPALALAGRALQLLTWRQDHRFCGRCGAATRLGPRGSALVCPGCGHESFPRVSPAVIVLVHDGDRVLLGRAPRFPEGMYSTLAGFVEPGESAEDTVHREILEESGVEVAGLRYMGSQSWPFPHSLMLGYHAAWAGGEVSCEDEELEDVRWFSVDDLPRLPSRHSIARRLIDTYVQSRIAERPGT